MQITIEVPDNIGSRLAVRSEGFSPLQLGGARTKVLTTNKAPRCVCLNQPFKSVTADAMLPIQT